jgi:hypothetical protein
MLSRGTELRLALPELKYSLNLSWLTLTNGFVTLAHAEREHIVRALDETNRVIGGPGGAAVPSSEADTLQ